MQRHLTPLDRLVVGVDRTLRGLHLISSKNTRAVQPNPADSVKKEAILTEEERRRSAGLMRVNHAGEIAAQALYQGQAITARSFDVKETMQQCAEEEIDHLVWCRERLTQLNSHTSYLAPFWYVGSLSMGVVAGIVGDKWSLGFVAETERQVAKHLERHLEKLPKKDKRSQRIVKKMRDDEEKHATTAVNEGAHELPRPIKIAMKWASRVMTTTAYWV